MLAAFTYDVDESPMKPDAFFRMKGVVTELCANLGIKNISFEPISSVSYLHPGRSASIIINGRTCGLVGYAHPQTAENFDAPESTVLLQLEVDAIILAATQKRAYTPLPKFPGITRDIAVILDIQIPVGSIEKIIRKKGGRFMESFSLFDVYTGAQIGASQKSVAYSLMFRSMDRTLTDADILTAYNDIVAALKKDLGAQLR
jgi:phenylalanyl-tRNA synthetase beta chain